MTHKPEIGVMFRREQHPATLADRARRAESLGFDQFWIVEDCFYLGGISQAAIALTATSTIKVGIGINPGVAHNPAILAMEYATLARAFPGRLIGGIGHGVAEWMEQIGEKPASPLTSIEEITTSLIRLLNGERITVDGRYVKLTDVELDPPQMWFRRYCWEFALVNRLRWLVASPTECCLQKVPLRIMSPGRAT